MLTIDTDRPDTEIVDAWIAWTASAQHRVLDRDVAGSSAEAEDDWGEQALLELVCEDPIRALEISFLIARKTDDDWLLCNLGAGPIESLLAHDATFLDAIAHEVPRSPNLKAALASVWQNAMSDATWQAVRRLAAS
uniref:DUF6869 domain-containing protein n=1 Tax=uncultured Caulobacter sp. TaxID=158749 RepID=UPI0025E650C6|nr:hypothetical protein [uncultured Caulobacter sp.]